MHSSVVFVLQRTSAEELYGWLSHWTRIDRGGIPYGNGRLILGTEDPHEITGGGTCVIAIAGIYVIVKAGDPYAGDVEEGSAANGEPLTGEYLKIESGEITAIRFEVTPLGGDRIEVRSECREPSALDYYNSLLKGMADTSRWPEAGEAVGLYLGSQGEGLHTEGATEQARGQAGRPALGQRELVMRLASAQEAEEIRAKNAGMRWKEIVHALEWPYGSNPAGIKLMENARNRLKWLEKDDPGGLLQEVAKWRKRRTS